MGWFNKSKTYLKLPFEVKLLFARAVFVSAIVKAALTFIPFKKIKPYLGTPNIESDKDCVEEQRIAYLRQVQTALKLCKKYTPWKTECYTLALTGKILLRRKKILSTLYIGFRKNTENEYEGHAWLRSGPVIVSGIEGGIPGYHIQSFFT